MKTIPYTQLKNVTPSGGNFKAYALPNFLSETITGPLGSMFAVNFGKDARTVEKIEENTFEILNGHTSAVVDGDHLINLVTGKQSISNLKFQ